MGAVCAGGCIANAARCLSIINLCCSAVSVLWKPDGPTAEGVFGFGGWAKVGVARPDEGCG